MNSICARGRWRRPHKATEPRRHFSLASNTAFGRHLSSAGSDRFCAHGAPQPARIGARGAPEQMRSSQACARGRARARAGAEAVLAPTHATTSAIGKPPARPMLASAQATASMVPGHATDIGASDGTGASDEICSVRRAGAHDGTRAGDGIRAGDSIRAGGGMRASGGIPAGGGIGADRIEGLAHTVASAQAAAWARQDSGAGASDGISTQLVSSAQATASARKRWRRHKRWHRRKPNRPDHRRHRCTPLDRGNDAYDGVGASGTGHGFPHRRWHPRKRWHPRRPWNWRRPGQRRKRCHRRVGD